MSGILFINLSNIFYHEAHEEYDKSNDYLEKDHKDSRGQGVRGSGKEYRSKKALDPLNPRILESFTPTNREKNPNYSPRRREDAYGFYLQNY